MVLQNTCLDCFSEEEYECPLSPESSHQYSSNPHLCSPNMVMPDIRPTKPIVITPETKLVLK